MPKKDDALSDFEALMREAGVTPLDGRGSGQRRSSARSSRAPSTPSSRSPTEPSSGRPSAPGRPSASGPSPAPATPPAELAALRRQLDEAEARARTLAAERDAAREEAARLQAALDEARSERDTFDAERRSLARRLQAERDRIDARPTPLDVPALLRERGLPASVHAEALSALLELHPDATLQALDGREEADLRELLDQRLVATCGQPACDPRVDSAAPVVVEAADCEICGGLQGGAAFARVASVCGHRGIARMVVVGGSPNSRRVLRDLADGAALRVETVDGASKPSARKVKTIERTTDLVVIWAGTQLDHATSAAFEGLDRRIETIPFRGVERMLSVLADRLDGRSP